MSFLLFQTVTPHIFSKLQLL